MQMSDIVRKVTSRKFLMALVTVITGIAMAFGIQGSEIVEVVSTIGGIVTALGGAVTYIVAEGKVDAASVAAKANAEETTKELEE